MKKIVVFGAGKSSSYLIQYLLNPDFTTLWQVDIVDQHTAHIQAKYANTTNLQLHNIDIHAADQRTDLIQQADLIISLLPPSLHIIIAKDCLAFKKNLITASYVSDDIGAMHDDLVKNNILFMCEMGLDPGIDHMSAMQIIDEIQVHGGKITEFKSHCGGLVAPESDTNLWHYKISWNPRNIITAGAAGAHYLLNNEEHHVPYNKIFKDGKNIDVAEIGQLAYYPNRDSLSYKKVYELTDVHTLMRTTLRYPAFNNAWQYIIDMGLTNDKDMFADTNTLTYNQWLQQVLQTNNVAETLQTIFGTDAEARQLFDELDITTDTIIGLGANKSSADILQAVIENKWKMQDDDKDMIVMQHEFNYSIGAEKYYWNSSLLVKGQDKTYTAMAKTVGLPMAIFAKLLLTNQIRGLSGVQIPVAPNVYKQVLAELQQQGIIFTEHKIKL
jgi:saccharopine dehydrogenase-like NADP-dependent oxidoreductase